MRTVVTAILQQTAGQGFGSNSLVSDGPPPVTRLSPRWAVDGREHGKSFKARPLADGLLTGLKDAVRDRRPFSLRTGLPDAETTGDELLT